MQVGTYAGKTSANATLIGSDDAAAAANPANVRPRVVLLLSAAEALTASGLQRVVALAGFGATAPPKKDAVMVMDDAIGNIN